MRTQICTITQKLMAFIISGLKISHNWILTFLCGLNRIFPKKDSQWGQQWESGLDPWAWDLAGGAGAGMA